jgi:hypothetical protein
MTQTGRARARYLNRPWVLFSFALGLRLLALALLPLHFPEADGARSRTWAWGAEAACLAQSLFEGRGYGDPWCLDTGPSAWLTPVYSSLIALLMLVCDGLNRATVLSLYVVQSLASALTALVVARLGAAVGQARAGLWAGYAWALYPPAIWNGIHTVWDTTFVALGVSLFLLAMASLPRAPLPRRVVPVGLIYGALLFLNPAPLAMLPAALAYLVLISERRPGPSIQSAWVFCVAAFAVCLPWMVRNRAVLDTASLRPNFGVEVRIGNHDKATGHPQPFRYHPSHVAGELALYRELGEAAYSADSMRRGLAWIRANPGAFLELSLLRTKQFWLGEWPPSDTRTNPGGASASSDPMSWIKWGSFAMVGLLGLASLVFSGLSREVRWLFGGGLILSCGPYVVTHVSERYRFPIDPPLILLATILVARCCGDRSPAPEESSA